MKLLVAFLFLAAPNPVAWKLDGPSTPIKPGATFPVKLTASIEKGWHLYWLRQVPDGPVATRIGLAEGQPFRLAAKVQAPAPEIVQDASFGMEIGQYEGETVFTLPVRVEASAAPGEHKLTASATYQTCNNKVCLPPRTVQTTAPVTIKK
jgi:thiol:disulfide interchange protein DsbD